MESWRSGQDGSDWKDKWKEWWHQRFRVWLVRMSDGVREKARSLIT